MNSHEVFIHIHQGCFAGTGAIVRLLQCQWSKPDGYGKISQCITTTKHSKAKTVCIFLWIYCTSIDDHAQLTGIGWFWVWLRQKSWLWLRKTKLTDDKFSMILIACCMIDIYLTKNGNLCSEYVAKNSMHCTSHGWPQMQLFEANAIDYLYTRYIGCVWCNHETCQMIFIVHRRQNQYTAICLQLRPIPSVHQETDHNLIMFIERRYFCMLPSNTDLSPIHVSISVLLGSVNTISRACLIAFMLCISKVHYWSS